MSGRECDSYRPLISDYLDGDLDPAERDRLLAHLDSCENCQLILESYERIREGIRDLPRHAPPPTVTHSIRRATVQRPPAPRWVRFFGFAGMRLGLSLVGALALLIVLCSFALVRGYANSISPAIAASAPAARQEWPTSQPVRIQFSKSMDHSSVEGSLRISPAGERDRLPLSWEGNTLVIGASSARSQPLLPNTDYTIMILADARDQNGNALGQVWTLSFHTGSSMELAAQATPTQAAASPRPAQPAVATVPAQPVATPPPTSAPAAVNPPATTQAEQPTPSTSQTTPDTTVAPPAAPTPVLVTPAPTPPAAKATQPATTPTPKPTVAVTPTPKPASTPATTPAPTAAPTAAATATATATPPPTPATATATSTAAAQTPAATNAPVVGALGSVYWSNADVQAKLGAPTGPEVKVNTAELGFQHGVMYERYDTGRVYVFLVNDATSGTWSSAQDTWTAADPPGGQTCGEPGDNLFQPTKGFFKIWSADDTLQTAIGCAVQSTTTLAANSIQSFANGQMLYGDQGFVYVVYNDGTWKLYPDTSGHGSLLTPTPEPATATPTSTPAAGGPTTTPGATSTPAKPSATSTAAP